MSSALNQRLHRLIEVVNPTAAAQHAKDGSWPTRDGGDPKNREHGQAPFIIDTMRDGATRLRLASADGDLVAGVGPDLDAALAALAAKLKIEDPPASKKGPK